MIASVTRLSGEEWQRWANQLLTRHYGPTEYQKVPDNDKGDAGIEGFTIAAGHAYQLYGCEEPLSTTARYEAQRDKMTTDIGKFIANRPVLQRILGSVKISRWALFIPFFDSKNVVAHASKKTDEVIAAKLPYVADGFRVVVCQEDDYKVERDQLLNASSNTLRLEATAATTEQVSQWVTANVGLAETLEDKLQRLPTLQDQSKRQTFRERVLSWYLEGQAILEGLRKYPEVYEKVVRAKSHRENYLVRTAMISPTAPAAIFESAVNDLLETLRREVKELHDFSAESLAHEAVADWLMRCPLDFPELVSNASN